MKFVWRWIRNRISNCDEVEQDSPRLSTAKVSRASDIDSDEGLNIVVRKAIGGKIVTFRHYDHKNDRSTWKNYVIPDELDFERELGKMITLESMR